MLRATPYPVQTRNFYCVSTGRKTGVILKQNNGGTDSQE